MIPQLWVGRVFLSGTRGGNHTGVMLDKWSDPASLAAALGFPDTAFVNKQVGRTVEVRTFSPYEEMAQCLQASMAVPIALGAGDGETWQIRHPASTIDVRVEREQDEWLCWAMDTDTAGAPERIYDLPDWLRPAEVWRLRQGRSRLYVRLPDVATLPTFDADDVLDVCRAHACTAVVFFAEASGSVVRTRVFTTSLNGMEDVATGGAAAGVGLLLMGAGRTGRVDVVQGPEESAKQGNLYLQLGRERYIGGKVKTLLIGTILTGSPAL